MAKDFENLSAEKRGDFRNILPQLLSPPRPACHGTYPAPRCHRAPGVQGAGDKPTATTEPDTRGAIRAEAQVWSRNTCQDGPDGPDGPNGHAAVAAKPTATARMP